MSRFRQFGGLKMASSLAVASFLSIAPAFADYGAPAGSSQPPGPGPSEPRQLGPSNLALAQFRDVLQRYGTIQNHPRYGEVWMPGQGVVPTGWSPYPSCHWVYDKKDQSWTYQDRTEWGAIVHHYGRWAFDSQAGWMWIADGAYGPGWVYWKNDERSVSWAALGPDSDGQSVPNDGWQTQDLSTFNAGCRRSEPSAPVAYQPPPAAPVYSAPSAPVYPAPPSYAPYPVYGGGGRYPTRPVPPVVIVTPGPEPYCQRSPWRPDCRRPQPPTGGGLDCRFPTFAARPECRAAQNPDICVRHPGLPHCRRQPTFAGGRPPFGPSRFDRFPERPRHEFGGMPRHNPSFGPFARNPGGFQPGGFRPSGHQPGGFRPGGFRPGGFRGPSFAGPRPSFNRPFGGGGARFARRH